MSKELLCCAKVTVPLWQRNVKISKGAVRIDG